MWPVWGIHPFHIRALCTFFWQVGKDVAASPPKLRNKTRSLPTLWSWRRFLMGYHRSPSKGISITFHWNSTVKVRHFREGGIVEAVSLWLLFVILREIAVLALALRRAACCCMLKADNPYFQDQNLKSTWSTCHEVWKIHRLHVTWIHKAANSNVCKS